MAAMGSMCRKSHAFLKFSRTKSPQKILLKSRNTQYILNDDIKFSRLSTATCQYLKSKRTLRDFVYPIPPNTFAGFASASSCVTDGRYLSLGSWAIPCLQSCAYSTSKSDSDLGITNDILKSKTIESEQNQESIVHEQSQNQSDQSESDSKGKSDEKSKKDSWFSSKHAWKLGLISLGVTSVLLSGQLVFLWGAPLKDPDGNDVEDEFSNLPKWKAYPMRSLKEAHFFKAMIEEPSYKKLLPDPLKEPWYQPPYTLVLEMTGVLVHPDWTLGTGWRFKKRPGIQYFLQQVASPLFEVVIFTREQGFTAFPIVDGLDPNGHITFRLFRDATRYMNGSHVKDLDNLNRDLSKVILVDCDPKSFQKHPRNALLLKKWAGTDGDTSLIDLAAFLRTIALSNVEDVRPVLEHYSQFDDPVDAFKQNQRKLQGEQNRKQAASEQQDQSLTGFGRSFLRKR